jgi:amino acid transporter
LKKVLTQTDLTALGIAAIIGAGIFSTIGKASFEGGPGVIVLFITTAFACLLSAFCYAEFASAFPSGGSAYTYAYARFGRFIGWIIGWDLFMEYAVGNIAVAISWSSYFSDILHQINFELPAFLLTDYNSYIQQALPITEVPCLFSIPIIFNLPAIAITVFITYLVWIGINASKKFNNVLVALKLLLLLVFIGVGFTYLNTDHFIPILPNGWTGVFKGTSAVFFAYIGFDAITTTANETIHPEKSLPRAIFLSLGITTILYILLCIVLIGMVPINELNLSDPLSYALHTHHLDAFAFVMNIGALIALSSVLLVFQIGQPRIWLAMSNDNLLPRFLSHIHPKHLTPSWATFFTGVSICIPLLFLDFNQVIDLTSIGTLFAFLVVSLGIWHKPHAPSHYKVPFVSMKKYGVFVLLIFIIGCWMNILQLFTDNVLFILTIITICFLIYSILYNKSMIPTMATCFNSYLLSTMESENWLRFGIWLVIGLIVYYFYGRIKNKETSTL